MGVIFIEQLVRVKNCGRVVYVCSEGKLRLENSYAEVSPFSLISISIDRKLSKTVGKVQFSRQMDQMGPTYGHELMHAYVK